VGVADCECAEVAAKIAATVIKLNDVFRISCASLLPELNANVAKRLPENASDRRYLSRYLPAV
jgi:hypothetical protein